MNNSVQQFMTSVEYGSMAAGVGLMQVEQILSAIFLGISIITGIVNFVLSIKRVSQDGKIEEHEYDQLQQQLDKIQTDIQEITKNGRNSK